MELAAAIKKARRAFRTIRLAKRPETYPHETPALNVLACVLSLNRRWDAFAAPRVDQFGTCRPRVVSLAQLRKLILKYPTPYEFSVEELNYKDAGRASVLLGVTEFAIKVQRQFNAKTEKGRLRAWAKSVSPADYKSVGVSGFGLAGFQQLRMNFGADTAKPDVHICRFIKEHTGQAFSPSDSLRIFEEAARQERLSPLALDYAIWKKYARR